MPSGVWGAGFGVINGHLYVAGGRDNGNVALATLYDYDIAGNSWTQKANMPAAANVPGSAAVAQDGRLWVFGGGAPFGNFQATSDYNPATNTWGTARA